MALKHKEYPLYGMQFHPESIGTRTGKQLLHEFYKIAHLREIEASINIMKRKRMGEFRMKQYLEKLAERQNLTAEEMREAAQTLFSEEVTDSEIAAFLMGLKAKGETAEEIASLAKVMREEAMTVQTKSLNVMDNCGTGGDGSQSFNISTTSAFVLAGAGVKVAKHGSRSISSKTGSADVLEELGIQLYLEREKMEEIFENLGITFLFAPSVHPKTARIVKVRKDLYVFQRFLIILDL